VIGIEKPGIAGLALLTRRLNFSKIYKFIFDIFIGFFFKCIYDIFISL